MAGTFPGVCNSQQFDINGNPSSACLLTVYAGGTTTLAATFQDIGLTLPTTNPLVGDASGRLPLFFVADGTYNIRLTDQFGLQGNGGFFLSGVPSIGASSSGGGGNAVDPTTIFSTGDVKWRLEQSTIAGWVRVNGKTVGNASSGASERANADCQALFIYVWQSYADAICPVVGGRGASGLADFSAGKQITLLDGRDRTIFALDDMGNAALGGFANVPFKNGNQTTGGSAGGEALHTLANSEIPPVPVNIQTGGESNSHTHTLTAALTNGTVSDLTPGSVAGSGNQNITTSGPNTDHTHNVSGNISGGGAAHNNTPLFLLGTLFWKL